MHILRDTKGRGEGSDQISRCITRGEGGVGKISRDIKYLKKFLNKIPVEWFIHCFNVFKFRKISIFS